MTEEHISNPKKGLPLNSVAPSIDTKDIYGNLFILETSIAQNNGILLDFFRGAW
jgi:hypothetical protein